MQGKRVWSDMDTRLACLEQAISRMRTAHAVAKSLAPGEQRGMSLDQPCTLELPAGAWYGIGHIVRIAAAAHELSLAVESNYSDRPGSVRVKFARRRGEL
jgi:hypothetical protein